MALNGLYPHSALKEDQPLSHGILHVHVIHRGIPIGAFVGGIIPVVKTGILRRPSPFPLSTQVLMSSSTGVIVMSGLMGVAVVGRMWGREEIEWKDRSWRLLENKGQCEVDDWSAGFGLGGALLGARAVRGVGPVWKGAVGGAGIGSLVGVGGYMAWRYGINGGKR